MQNRHRRRGGRGVLNFGDRFADAFNEKGRYPNVDLYSASVYTYLGIPTDLFTPLFAASRVVGQAAHVLEQRADNKLIRPWAEYVGEPRREFPVRERS